MKHVKFDKTGKRGWFIGDFPSAAYQTDKAEVCYTIEPANSYAPHYHTKCTEIVYIISGKVSCNGSEYSDGDILIFEPGEVNDCHYLIDSAVIGVKTPAGGNDKVHVDGNT